MAVTIAAAILVGGAVVDRATALEAERAETVAELIAVTERVDTSAARTAYLEGAVERAEEDAADRDAVLEVRPASSMRSPLSPRRWRARTARSTRRRTGHPL